MAGNLGKWFNRFLGRSKPVCSGSSGEEGQAEKDGPRSFPSDGVNVGVLKISLEEGSREAASPLQAPSFVPDSGAWKPGDIVLDDYRVEGELGRGGMGRVYLMSSKKSGKSFAVKKATLGNELAKRNFLVELQIWMDLPEHEHLAACRFFRTVGDEIAIFAEYLEGGSLADWIKSKRLYDGGRKKALERILDVAIQSAWGLHAAHELGLVHQDVKPANILMTRDGIVKIADFGLARARASVGEQAPPPQASIMVSFGGMTPAYCSPEQAARKALSAKTDIWSWGLSVLEMFSGEVSWSSGTLARGALDSYVERDDKDGLHPLMPEKVIEILRRCFERDPAKRWGTMREVADNLSGVYMAITGNHCPRSIPAFPRVSDRYFPRHDRWTTTGIQWSSPREWLDRALRADGRDPVEMDDLLPSPAGSRKAQAVADLAGYEEAFRILSRLVQDRRQDLEIDLASFCLEKALIHQTLGDFPGTLALEDRAILIITPHVNQREYLPFKGRHAYALLADAYMFKAVTFSMFLSDHKSAVSLYDQAIIIYEQLLHDEEHPELVVLWEKVIAITYANKAVAKRALGDPESAITLYNSSIEIWKKVINMENVSASAGFLAKNYLNKGVLLGAIGDLQGSINIYNQARDIFERLVSNEEYSEYSNDLAAVWMNIGTAHHRLGKEDLAAESYDHAIEIRKKLLVERGMGEVAHDLALSYMNKGVLESDRGDQGSAISLYDHSIEIYEQLVYGEGKQELANDLARCYMNKANALRSLGDSKSSLVFVDRAIQLRENLVYQENRKDLESGLARCYANKGYTLRFLGNNLG